MAAEMRAEENSARKVHDVAIIGAGPAGASAAIYAARSRLDTLVIDKGLRSGALGMAAKIANYPGVPGEISGAELLAMMRSQAEGLGARFVQDKVLGTNLGEAIKDVLGSKDTYAARTAIIATGSMGRALHLPGEERLVGRGVSYCATCDGAFFRDKEVVVAGNNDEAAEEALLLARFASQVHLLVQTSEPRASAALIRELNQHPKVQVHLATRLLAVNGDQQVSSVRVSLPSEQENIMPADGVFIYLQGGRPVTNFLEGQLQTSEAGCLAVDEAMQTTIPGVFAVGDVLCNHLRQAVVAAAEGARAAMAAQRYLSGREKLRLDWF